MQAPCHARRLYIWRALAGSSAFVSRLRATHFDAAPHTRGATRHCRRAGGSAPCLGHADLLHTIEKGFVRADTHEERGFAQRARYCPHGSLLDALGQ